MRRSKKQRSRKKAKATRAPKVRKSAAVLPQSLRAFANVVTNPFNSHKGADGTISWGDVHHLAAAQVPLGGGDRAFTCTFTSVYAATGYTAYVIRPRRPAYRSASSECVIGHVGMSAGGASPTAWARLPSVETLGTTLANGFYSRVIGGGIKAISRGAQLSATGVIDYSHSSTPVMADDNTTANTYADIRGTGAASCVNDTRLSITGGITARKRVTADDFVWGDAGPNHYGAVGSDVDCPVVYITGAATTDSIEIAVVLHVQFRATNTVFPWYVPEQPYSSHLNALLTLFAQSPEFTSGNSFTNFVSWMRNNPVIREAWSRRSELFAALQLLRAIAAA